MKRYEIGTCPFGYEIFEVGGEKSALVNDLEFAEKIRDLLNVDASQVKEQSDG